MFKRIWGLMALLVLSQGVAAELPGKDKLSDLKEKLGERVQAQVVNKGGKCLKAGGEVNIANCGSAPELLWRFDNGRLRNIGSNKCLDVPDMKANGGKVQTFDCNDAPNQQFKLEGGRLKNTGGKCLDVPDMNADNGRVQLLDCNDAPNQKWELR